MLVRSTGELYGYGKGSYEHRRLLYARTHRLALTVALAAGLSISWTAISRAFAHQRRSYRIGGQYHL